MTLPEWLVERGIGETRAALVDHGEIIEARIQLDGSPAAGTVLDARLASIGMNGRNAVAVSPEGTEYLLPRGAPGVREGAARTIHPPFPRRTTRRCSATGGCAAGAGS